MNVAIDQIIPKGENASSIKASRNIKIKLTIIVKRANNQNSDLDARPEKLVYFTKQVLTASKKFISVISSYCKSNDPRTSKKHGNRQADGGGQVFDMEILTENVCEG
jgi:hypothetical protein